MQRVCTPPLWHFTFVYQLLSNTIPWINITGQWRPEYSVHVHLRTSSADLTGLLGPCCCSQGIRCTGQWNRGKKGKDRLVKVWGYFGQGTKTCGLLPAGLHLPDPGWWYCCHSAVLAGGQVMNYLRAIHLTNSSGVLGSDLLQHFLQRQVPKSPVQLRFSSAHGHTHSQLPVQRKKT